MRRSIAIRAAVLVAAVMSAACEAPAKLEPGTRDLIDAGPNSLGRAAFGGGAIEPAINGVGAAVPSDAQERQQPHAN